MIATVPPDLLHIFNRSFDVIVVGRMVEVQVFLEHDFGSDLIVDAFTEHHGRICYLFFAELSESCLIAAPLRNEVATRATLDLEHLILLDHLSDLYLR